MAIQISGTPIITDTRTIQNYGLTTQTLGSISGSVSIDIRNGNFVTATIAGATTFTFTNPLPSPNTSILILELTNAGSAAVVFPNIRWPGGITPTLTSSGVDVIVLVTDDAGSNWRGSGSMLDSRSP
jgi:hypothetical protein